MPDLDHPLPYASFDSEAFNDDEVFTTFTLDASTTWSTRSRISTAEPHGGTILVGSPSIIPLVSSPTPTTVVYRNGIPSYQFEAGLTATDQGTTWGVYQTIRLVRGTSWSVATRCRGTQSFAPFDTRRILAEGGVIRDAFVAQSILCLLSPFEKSRSQGSSHTATYGIIAQSRDLYMDSRGIIYYKNADLGMLGQARSIKASAYPTYTNQIMALQAVLV